MKRFFIAIVMLFVLALCPLSRAEEPGTASGPGMHEDSGLTWYQIAGLLAAIGTATTLGWQGHKKMNAIRIEPQPLEVKRIAECATRKELDDFKTEVREDFRRVHNRIDSNDRATAEIKGKLDVIAQNQQKLIDLITQRHG
ncbi:MAG: hypothetical protein IKY91_00690 [Akkermansia sp.]|nr:hypothetical protein [Akkermansia sp.]